MPAPPADLVAFRCEAGYRHGLGHLMRCLSLAEAFRDRGLSPLFVAADPEGIAERIAHDRGFRFETSPGEVGSAADREHMLRLAATRGLPLAVVDSKEADAAYCAALAERLSLVCLDDERCRDLPCRMLINPNVWADSTDYPARPGRVVRAGAAANLIGDAFFAARRRERPAGSPVRLLITMGGEDPGNDTAWMLRTLAGLLDGHPVYVVVGPAHPAPREVSAAAAEFSPAAECVIDPPAMAPYIAWADLAITAAGTTCYELAAAGVPQLGVVIEEHQHSLADAMAAAGCMIVLGRHGDMVPAEVRDTVLQLLAAADERAAMAKAAAALFARSGIGPLADEITGMIRRHEGA